MESIDELKAQLEEQKSTLESVTALAQDAPNDEEIKQMQIELQELVTELTHQIRVLEPSTASPSKVTQLQVGNTHRFRHTDGRWHVGEVQDCKADGVEMKFCLPTKPYMLENVTVASELVDPVTSSIQWRASVGDTVLALNQHTQLWEAAEVFETDTDAHQIVFLLSGRQARLPRAHTAPLEEDCDSSSAITEDTQHTASEDESRAEMSTVLQERDDRDTVHLAEWEQHTRGIGSKMMMGMGYRIGNSLGCRSSGILRPLQVQMFKPGAGLGLEGGMIRPASNTSQRKRRRGGRKARKAKEAKAAFDERQARKDAELKTELETGDTGVFALVNQRLGDQSESAKRLRAACNPQQQLDRDTKGGYFSSPGLSTVAKKNEEQCRRKLVSGQEEIAAVQNKIARLKEMGIRNTKDRTIAKQVMHKLQAAEGQLKLLQKQHANSMSALQAKENHTKWLKF